MASGTVGGMKLASRGASSGNSTRSSKAKQASARAKAGTSGRVGAGGGRRTPPKARAQRRSSPSRSAGAMPALAAERATPKHQGDLVGLAILVVVLALGLAEASILGSVGRYVDGGLSYLLGPARIVDYLYLAAIGAALLLEARHLLPRRFVVSGVISLWALAGLGAGYLWVTEALSSHDAMGRLGGVIGYYSFSATSRALGNSGALLVLGMVLVGFGLDALGNSPIAIIRRFRRPIAARATPSSRAGEEIPSYLGDQDSLTESSEARGSFLSRRFAARHSPYDYDAEEALDPRRPDYLDQDAPRESGGDPLGRGATVPSVARASSGASPQAPEGELEEPAALGDAMAMAPSPLGVPTNWKLPAAALLKRSVSRALDKDELWKRGKVLAEALATHKVETSLVGMTVGPTVTRYELELGSGVKVARVTSLHKDIAYAMAAADVRILAPIPGRSAIGVEVPNTKRVVVALADVLSAPEAIAATHPLAVAVGRDISGKAAMANLAEMPHVLIAGATGSGKSSCLNSILTSILMRTTPDEVRLILVDPKRVELGQYNGVPHLLTPVVTNPKKAANALAWAVKEMERRYDMLSELGARDIGGYNQIVANLASEYTTSDEVSPIEIESGPAPLFDSVAEKRYGHLPYILVVVDELNDLMMVAARDVEDSICRIAQMARAVGIHLVIATQRPSVDVITGLIKANIPSRMAFSVSSLADSRVILDQPGAERLIGKGDMLLLGASSSHPQRIQAPWVSEEEVRKVVASWIRQGKAAYMGEFEAAEAAVESASESEDEDELFGAAMELVVSSQLGSTSMLQRKLKVGFSRAGRLMDLLERRGIVGPLEGSKPRVVLMGKEEYQNYLESRA